MTKEERDATIKQIERVQNHLASIGETVDYLDFAIQALESQTSDECLVELKKELENRRDSYNYYGNEYEAACYQSFDTAVDMVDDTIQRGGCE